MQQKWVDALRSGEILMKDLKEFLHKIEQSGNIFAYLSVIVIALVLFLTLFFVIVIIVGLSMKEPLFLLLFFTLPSIAYISYLYNKWKK